MHLIPGEAYHVFNRGNNCGRIFFNERNYLFFLDKIQTHLSPICEILCWCLMPNHFHLIIYTSEKTCAERPSYGGKPMQEFPFQIGILLSSYSQAINKQNKTSGSLFQQKTKVKCLTGTAEDAHDGQRDYLTICTHYVHQNPWKAGLVQRMEDWKFCSFRDYIGISTGQVALDSPSRQTHLLCNSERLFALTGLRKADLYKESYKVIDESEWSDRFERPDH